ncbi:MAG: membrane protein insertion efficiency factor YidD [Bacteroidota bacterium]
MTFILQFIIKIYWFMIPPTKRNQCLFKESCSKIVYRISQEQGFFSAIRTFYFRYKNCRSDYHLFLHNDQICLRTKENYILDNSEINPEILQNKKS